MIGSGTKEYKVFKKYKNIWGAVNRTEYPRIVKAP